MIVGVRAGLQLGERRPVRLLLVVIDTVYRHQNVAGMSWFSPKLAFRECKFRGCKLKH